MSEEIVNCGRCAHLANRERNMTGFGRCGCTARQHETGEIRPLLALTSTCAHALLSAKYDPDFLAKIHANRITDEIPSIL